MKTKKSVLAPALLSALFLSLSFAHAPKTYALEPANNIDYDAPELDPDQTDGQVFTDQGIDLEPGDTPNDTSAEGPIKSIQVDVYKKESNTGINKEFVTVTVNGQIRHAFVASTAVAFAAGKAHLTPEFQNIKLTIPKVHGIPYPWTTSGSYGGSPMFWGLQIHGGYWIHSSPHYPQFGSKASMGCVRIDFPAAMELWDLVVNQAQGQIPAVINVYGTSMGAKGRSVLEQHMNNTKVTENGVERNLTLADIQKTVDADLQDTKSVHLVRDSSGMLEYQGRGHKRTDDKELVFPSCGGHDCFSSFGVKKPLN